MHAFNERKAFSTNYKSENEKAKEEEEKEEGLVTSRSMVTFSSFCLILFTSSFSLTSVRSLFSIA